MTSPKFECRSSNVKNESIWIDQWKYEVLRRAILQNVPNTEPGISFKELVSSLKHGLPVEIRKNLGSLGWYVTTVKSELEVRGEVKVLQNKPSQRYIRSCSPRIEHISEH